MIGKDTYGKPCVDWDWDLNSALKRSLCHFALRPRNPFSPTSNKDTAPTKDTHEAPNAPAADPPKHSFFALYPFLFSHAFSFSGRAGRAIGRLGGAPSLGLAPSAFGAPSRYRGSCPAATPSTAPASRPLRGPGAGHQCLARRHEGRHALCIWP